LFYIALKKLSVPAMCSGEECLKGIFGRLLHVDTPQWGEFVFSPFEMNTRRSKKKEHAVTKGVAVGLLTHDCDRTLFVLCVRFFFAPILSLYFVYPLDRFLTSFQSFLLKPYQNIFVGQT